MKIFIKTDEGLESISKAVANATLILGVAMTLNALLTVFLIIKTIG